MKSISLEKKSSCNNKMGSKVHKVQLESQILPICRERKFLEDRGHGRSNVPKVQADV